MDLLLRQDPPEMPASWQESPEGDLYRLLLEIRDMAAGLAAGDLNREVRSRGYVPGLLKSHQASLRHLTWQTRAIASGDFSQTVDFLGEFSVAFNSMTQRLEETVTRLTESETRQRLLADHASDVIWTMDLKGKFTYVSPSVERIRGYRPEEVLEQMPSRWLEPESLPVFENWLEAIRRSVSEGNSCPEFRGELWQTGRAGRPVPTEVTLSGIFGPEGQFLGILGICRDIRERIRLEEEIRLLSVTDKLTGLANRLKLDEVLEQELARVRRGGSPFSVILADVDYFKRINDTWGHQAGDLVLKDLACLLAGGVRTTDLAGRWGGEEFLVVAIRTSPEGGAILAEKLRERVEAHRFSVPGPVTISLGVAGSRPGDTADQLLLRADRALYRAKTLGRNRVESGVFPDQEKEEL